MKSVNDSVFGIDYYYRGISIDQKFSFGDLGKNIIRIRSFNKRLVNKSDWTMAIGEKEIDFFETSLLADYVKTNWNKVQKNTVKRNTYYNCNKINLNDFYYKKEIVPIKCSVNEKELNLVLNDISSQKIDYTNNLCLLNCLL